MLLADSLVEENISTAIRRGEFDDLPGKGKPLILDDDNGVPDELRVAYRILKNAGCLPPELALRSEIHELESLLNQVEAGNVQQTIRRRLYLLKARLATDGHKVNLLVQERAYRAKLISRMAREGSENTRGHKGIDDK